MNRISTKEIVYCALLILCGSILAHQYTQYWAPAVIPKSGIILFSQYASGLNYLNREDFSQTEPWGIWSAKPDVNLTIPLEHAQPKKITFVMRGLVNDRHPQQRIFPTINTVKLPMQRLTQFDNNIVSMDIPDLGPMKTLLINLETPDRVTPASIGMKSDDERLLGIGLISAKIEY